MLLTLFASAPHFHLDSHAPNPLPGHLLGQVADQQADPARVAEASSFSSDRDHDEHDAFPQTSALPCGVCRSADETHLAAGRAADVFRALASRRGPDAASPTAPRGPARSAHPTRGPPRLA